ncbi:MAG: SDR family oxidoreductase [Acidimicrobiales bacterium]
MTGRDGAPVAVITGGGTGIGRAVAVELAAAGWALTVVGRRPEPLAETLDLAEAATWATSTGQAGPAPMAGDAGTQRGLAMAADVTDEAAVEAVFARTVERFGRVDLLFNNAGTGAPPKPFEDLTLDEWQRVVAVNLTGSFLCARAAVAQMKRQDPQGGRIINNGSISADRPRPNSAPYTATKHAITGLTKSLALDGRGFGIACGQIDIGNAVTPMTEAMAAGVAQPDGTVRPEPRMPVEDVARTVRLMAELPPESNLLFATVMATEMPLIGRG